MSAPKFREGDVVLYTGLPRLGRDRWPGLDGEKRVRDVAPAGMVYLEDDGGYGGCCPINLTLLRRPVRVGDVLSWSATVNFNAPHERYFKARKAHVLDPNLHTLATHLDGTPIDPPISGKDLQTFEGVQIHALTSRATHARARDATAPHPDPVATYDAWWASRSPAARESAMQLVEQRERRAEPLGPSPDHYCPSCDVYDHDLHDHSRGSL